VSDQTIYLPPESYQQEVEQFYMVKRGSVPKLEEAWHYLIEERGEVNAVIVYDPEETKREHLAKELADELFTLYGVAIAAGIDLDKAFQLVCDSNMTKEYTPDGKVLKGENYREPDMREALL
jgi:predicted HAD superfamily Cof-like phosphohydrolase